MHNITGLGETLMDIAMAVLRALADVGGLDRLFLEAFGEDGVVDQGGVVLHRLIDIGDISPMIHREVRKLVGQLVLVPQVVLKLRFVELM